MQALGHVALHLREPALDQLEHRGLALQLRLGDMVQPAGQPLLPLAKRLHPLAKLGQRMRQPGGAIGGADHHDDHHQKQQRHRGGGPEARILEHQGKRVGHVRPKSRSISVSFSST